MTYQSARGPRCGAPRHHAPLVIGAVTSGSALGGTECGEIRPNHPRRRQEQATSPIRMLALAALYPVRAYEYWSRP